MVDVCDGPRKVPEKLWRGRGIIGFLKKGKFEGLCFLSVKYEAVEDDGVNRMWLCQ